MKLEVVRVYANTWTLEILNRFYVILQEELLHRSPNIYFLCDQKFKLLLRVHSSDIFLDKRMKNGLI